MAAVPWLLVQRTQSLISAVCLVPPVVLLFVMLFAKLRNRSCGPALD